jgi:hypothetical protein
MWSYREKTHNKQTKKEAEARLAQLLLLWAQCISHFSEPIIMRQINDFFRDAPPSTLFHYTGIDALLGIAETKSIWASSAYYLNDSKEIAYACEVLEKVIQSYQMAGNRSADEKEFLENVRNWVSSCKTTAYNIFIFSLSEERSLLSQWRSYTPHGKGVSIGFPSTLVKKIRTTSSMRLAKCLYERSEQEELVHSLTLKMLTTFNQDKPSIHTSGRHRNIMNT